MSHKYQVTLSDPAAEQLEQLAAGAAEPPTTLAGHFIRGELARAASEGKVRPPRQRTPATGALPAGGRARWLEPYGGDQDWRAQMWGQLVALHGRYPKALSWLQEGWWEEETLLETLCALAVWRAELDDSGVDAREELAFQLQLRELSHVLREAGGGVSRAWKPGAMPDSWRES
ncbi:MAG TPA: hypothetical protein VH081_07875 [Solirubrobacteraceae bacterium]|jgi:hypothetical protein|nr:hypothetical protein [Solirubrobacteraceae bacterium]